MRYGLVGFLGKILSTNAAQDAARADLAFVGIADTVIVAAVSETNFDSAMVQCSVSPLSLFVLRLLVRARLFTE